MDAWIHRRSLSMNLGCIETVRRRDCSAHSRQRLPNSPPLHNELVPHRPNFDRIHSFPADMVVMVLLQFLDIDSFVVDIHSADLHSSVILGYLVPMNIVNSGWSDCYHRLHCVALTFAPAADAVASVILRSRVRIPSIVALKLAAKRRCQLVDNDTDWCKHHRFVWPLWMDTCNSVRSSIRYDFVSRANAIHDHILHAAMLYNLIPTSNWHSVLERVLCVTNDALYL